jgi:hypothetical protein
VSADNNWATEGIKARDEARELNKVAKPKGYVVAFDAVEIIDHPRLPGGAMGPAHGSRVPGSPQGCAREQRPIIRNARRGQGVPGRVPRQGAVMKIPTDIDGAVLSLKGLGELITASEWERAAIVWAFTEDRNPGRNSSTFGRMSAAEFASQSIAGLTSKQTVVKYRKAWKLAIEHGFATDVEPGDLIDLPEAEWRQYFNPPRPKGDKPPRKSNDKPWAIILFQAVGNERIQPVHRALTTVLHPDKKTGSHELQQQLNAARDALLK